MRTGVQDSSDIAQRHPQHWRPPDLQDDVTHRGPAPRGGSDKGKLSIISSASDGQTQLSGAGAGAQRNEALLDLHTGNRSSGTGSPEAEPGVKGQAVPCSASGAS